MINSPPYFHHNIAVPNPKLSEVIMRSKVDDGFGDDFPTGVIHLDGVRGRYGISLQAHPELISIMHRIISVGMSGDPKYIDGTTPPHGHEELINSISRFISSFKEGK